MSISWIHDLWNRFYIWAFTPIKNQQKIQEAANEVFEEMGGGLNFINERERRELHSRVIREYRSGASGIKNEDEAKFYIIYKVEKEFMLNTIPNKLMKLNYEKKETSLVTELNKYTQHPTLDQCKNRIEEALSKPITLREFFELMLDIKDDFVKLIEEVNGGNFVSSELDLVYFDFALMQEDKRYEQAVECVERLGSNYLKIWHGFFNDLKEANEKANKVVAK